MKYVFGPVPSRRLGQSLGIDIIPLKTCNWNCVYCQLGRTVPLTNERRRYAPAEGVLLEVEGALRSHSNRGIDWVTFVGSGEATLHSELGWLVRRVKSLASKPVAVITNGSLLYLSEVRRDLTSADAVLPTLDAGTSALYRKINRPHPAVTFERLVDGLIAFRNEYPGRLWIEVMLVHGLNDTPSALRDIAGVLQKIRPDAVHLNLPVRPPAEPWVQLPDEDSLQLAVAILGDIAEVVRPAQGAFDLGRYGDLADAIMGIITRHPVRQEELERALGHWSPKRIGEALAELRASGRAQTVERHGAYFWSAASARYPEQSQSRRTAQENLKDSKKIPAH